MKSQLFKTKIVTVAFAFTISTVSNFSLLAQFGGGQGTQADPYRIYTKQHLEELADSVAISPSNDFTTCYNWSRDKYFKVMNDITSPLTQAIGLMEPSASFQGHFDGQNNTITVNINGTGNNLPAGLFCSITIGSIKNVIVSGSINLNTTVARVGGIAGAVIFSIFSENIKISNCVNNVDIIVLNSIYNECGGILGTSQRDANAMLDTIKNEIIIENCTNIGSIKGLSAGGIMCSCSKVKINNCINDGLIYGDILTGGIAGNIGNRTTISGCFNGGVVSGNGVVGCIVGTKEAGATVINNHYDMQMCGEE